MTLLGQTIGKCRIEKLLGSGGMGEVYRCRHIHLDRLQAIKVMHESMARDSGFQARFRQEAHAVALLDHANIVKLYDFGEQDGRFYLTMELLEDGSLRALLDRRSRDNQVWPPSFGLALVRQAAEALAFANAKGIVHRDIKPDNLLVLRQKTSDGRSTYTIKVSDFGLAKMAESSGLTSMGSTVGTPAYMSPEQCQGLPLDGRSDIYSLGVVLYEVMTGFLPFNINSQSDAIKKHMFTPVPPPSSVKSDLPREIEAVILKCLAKEPTDRYIDAGELATVLRDLARRLSPSPTPTPPPTPPPEPNMRHIQVIDAQGQLVQAVDLVDVQLMIGRMPDNDIVLDEPSISRKHARIEWNGQRVKVVDLATKSGTKLNDQPVLPEAPQVWQVGQAVQISSYTLRLALGSAGTVNVTLPPEAQRLTLAPGAPVSIPVTIQNRRTAADTFLIVIDEWPAAWIAEPVQPTLVNAGGQGIATVKLLVPDGVLREAASYSVRICAIGKNRPDSLDTTPAVWRIVPPVQPKIRIQLDPDRMQGRDQARYTVRLTNESSRPMDVALSGQDARKQLAYSFEPTNLTVAAGSTADVVLTVRSDKAHFYGGALTHSFTVSASVAGAENQLVVGSFVQMSLLPI